VTPEDVHRLVSRLDREKADAIVLLATDLPTFSVIRDIEAETRLPVLSSNQTLLWYGLRVCGNTAELLGLGRLFGHPLRFG